MTAIVGVLILLNRKSLSAASNRCNRCGRWKVPIQMAMRNEPSPSRPTTEAGDLLSLKKSAESDALGRHRRGPWNARSRASAKTLYPHGCDRVWLEVPHAIRAR